MNIYDFISMLLICAATFTVGICLIAADKRKLKNCTGLIEGRVCKYFLSSDYPIPIVEYTVNGVTYHKKRVFKYCVITTPYGISKSPDGQYLYDNGLVRIYIDAEKDVVHLNKNRSFSIMDFNEIGNRIWPIGSTMTVNYNPNKPKQAYVGRSAQMRAFSGKWLVGIGIFLMLISLIIFMFA